jgi:hypothetical protein
MKIKKNTFSTLVLELFFPSIANCMKLKIQINPKIRLPLLYMQRSVQLTYLVTEHEANTCVAHLNVTPIVKLHP